jgi:hypothetical protein
VTRHVGPLWAEQIAFEAVCFTLRGSTSMNEPDSLSPDVRAAISDFLNDIQEDGQPFDVTIAVDAVKRVFPGVEISDAALLDAIVSEASVSGFDIDYDVDSVPKSLKKMG